MNKHLQRIIWKKKNYRRTDKILWSLKSTTINLYIPPANYEVSLRAYNYQYTSKRKSYYSLLLKHFSIF